LNIVYLMNKIQFCKFLCVICIEEPSSRFHYLNFCRLVILSVSSTNLTALFLKFSELYHTPAANYLMSTFYLIFLEIDNGHATYIFHERPIHFIFSFYFKPAVVISMAALTMSSFCDKVTFSLTI